MRSASFARRVAIGLAALICAALHAQDARSLSVDLGEEQAIELVHLPAGTFEQGSPVTEPQRGADETQRTVTLTRAFFLGRFPVTWGEFARFVADTGYHTEAERGTEGGIGWDGAQFLLRKEFTWKMPGFAQTDEDPVTLVTHNDAHAFLAWLSESGRRSRPAEHSGNTRAGPAHHRIPNGDDTGLDAIAWFRGNSGGGTRPSAKGAQWGSATCPATWWEWCEDWYAPYSASPATDPLRAGRISRAPRRVILAVRGRRTRRPAAPPRHPADPVSRHAVGFRVMTFDPRQRLCRRRRALPARYPARQNQAEPFRRDNAAAPASSSAQPRDGRARLACALLIVIGAIASS